MLSTPHLLVGAAVGTVAAPLGLPTVFLLALLSHFILDMVPHSDEYLLDNPGHKKIMPVDYAQVTLDIVVGSLFVLYVAGYHSVNPTAVIIGALGAVTPDLINNVPFWSPTINTWPVIKQFGQLHQAVDGSMQDKHKLFGVVTQFTVIILAVMVMLR
jgi:hypothetical protein